MTVLSRSQEILPGPLYIIIHVTNATAKFEVAMSNGLPGDAIKRRYIIYKNSDRWTDIGMKLIIYPFYIKKKGGKK